MLLSEFDIVYVNQKSVKGRAVADFLASRVAKNYEPLNFDFPDEDLISATAEGGIKRLHCHGNYILMGLLMLSGTT